MSFSDFLPCNITGEGKTPFQLGILDSEYSDLRGRDNRVRFGGNDNLYLAALIRPSPLPLRTKAKPTKITMVKECISLEENLLRIKHKSSIRDIEL